MHLDGSKACIWCLGGPIGTREGEVVVESELPSAAARTFLRSAFGSDIYGGRRGCGFGGWREGLNGREEGR